MPTDVCGILPAARGEAISRRFGHGLRTWSIKASGRTKRKFSLSRSRDCPGRGRSISPPRSTTRRDRQGRRWFIAHGTLRCRPYHTDQAAQGLLITEELGDADRQACPREQGQGGRARRLAVIMHRMLAERAPSTLQQSDRRRATVRARHHAFSKRSAFAGTMDHVRQNYKN